MASRFSSFRKPQILKKKPFFSSNSFNFPTFSVGFSMNQPWNQNVSKESHIPTFFSSEKIEFSSSSPNSPNSPISPISPISKIPIPNLVSGNFFRNFSKRSFAGMPERAEIEKDKEKEKEIIADIITPFKCHKIESPSMKIDTNYDEIMSMFRTMNVIRRTEIAADMVFKRQLGRGFCHLYDGQEGVAVGMEGGLSFTDSVITAYRDHGIYISRGGTPYEVFCELMGRRDGPARGKGGSMHLYKRQNNFYGGWGIVGTSGPLGTGLALGQKVERKQRVTVAVYGDGAANQGQIYEAYNMAGLWKLPVIYVVENNHYGMGTSESRASAQPSFYDRVGYIPGIKVDGMDVFAVKSATRFAKEYAIKNGPIILEMDTYRYHGHSMSDPGSTYRERSEIQDMRHSRDCISRLRQLILKEELHSEEELKSIEKEIRSDVEKASEEAQKCPEPEEKELWSNVYRKDEGITHQGINRRETQVKMP